MRVKIRKALPIKHIARAPRRKYCFDCPHRDTWLCSAKQAGG
jgi:hypothetical protein